MQEQKLQEIAMRIRTLREIMEIPVAEMAQQTGLSAEEYLAAEDGKSDFTFTFLYNCAQAFGVDIIELLTGEAPHLSFYSIVRKGEGLSINRRAGFTYNHLAYRFSRKIAEPFLVTIPYVEEDQDKPIHLSYHKGQELDYIISGHLRFSYEGHTEDCGPGDVLMYDSARGHGLLALDGEPVVLLAVVIEPSDKQVI